MSSTAPAVEALSTAHFRSLGARPALYEGRQVVGYAELCGRVEERIEQLGSGRRLVALAGDNSLETVVTFLAALEARHVLLIVESGVAGRRIVERYRPDTTVEVSGGGAVEIDVRPRQAESNSLHADLALLLSTSGSTGAAKLVRLARDGVMANAEAIAEYLRLDGNDRGITSLPLHYCYGLSVLTSHLAVGGSVVLTGSSVVDPCFEAAFDRWGVTGFAGVPYSFDMLERRGFDLLGRPSLRYVTQAGGRFDPATALRVAEYGRDHDWELFVMYGQTEATARMAYLPPDAVFEHPGAVGRAIPGGSIRLDHSAIAETYGRGCGEVLYRGPNVMMGYALDREDLAKGREIDELRTGDIGRFNAAGFLELVGRMNRFIKVFGKRIDLDDAADRLTSTGETVATAGDDEGLVVAVLRPGLARPLPDLQRKAAEVSGLSTQRVTAVALPALPRTSSDKLNTAELTRVAREVTAQVSNDARSNRSEPTGVAALYAEMLGVPEIPPDASFAELGGDSLTYVETSMRLESLVGELPSDWHLRPVESLANRPAPRRSAFTTQLDTSVVVRAVAISLIVCTHMGIFRLAGGAHALLAVLGFNFARFQLSAVQRPGRLRRGLGSIARVAIPTSVWIATNIAVAGGYSVGSLFLVNNYFGSPYRTDGRWQYWYFEAFVQITLVLVLLFSIGSIRRAERRAPFLFALGIVLLTVPVRFEWISFGHPYNEIFRPHTAVCFVAIGWLAAVARTAAMRTLATAVAAVVTLGYFETVGRSDQLDRELRILVIVAALIWIPRITLPRGVANVVGWVAAASMWIFLIHWQVWPTLTSHLDDRIAWAATMATGIAVWFLVDRFVLRRATALRQRLVPRRASSEPRQAEPASQTLVPGDPRLDATPTHEAHATLGPAR